MKTWMTTNEVERAVARRAARASAEPWSLDALSRALLSLYGSLLAHPASPQTPVLNSPAL
jgi:hypothetical protein